MGPETAGRVELGDGVEGAGVEEGAFRRTVARFASGICIVTTREATSITP